MRKQMPRTGREVITPDGTGTVLENNVITERTRVKVALSDGTFDVREYPFRELQVKNAPARPKQNEEEWEAEEDSIPSPEENDPALSALDDSSPAAEPKKPPKKRHPGRSIIPQYYMLTGKEIRMQRISSLQKNTGTRLGGFRCFLCLNIFEVKHYSSVSTQPSSQRRYSIMKDASTLCPESTG